MESMHGIAALCFSWRQMVWDFANLRLSAKGIDKSIYYKILSC